MVPPTATISRPAVASRIATRLLGLFLAVAIARIVWGLAPWWARILLIIVPVIGWAVARTCPPERRVWQHALDLAAQAIVDALGKVMAGIALAVGVLAVLVLAVTLGASWLSTQIGHLTDQAGQTIHTAVQDAVPDVPDLTQLPGQITGWISSHTDK
jgi:hypothetical protein